MTSYQRYDRLARADEDRALLRDAMLDAAEEVLRTDGWSALTMRRLATMVGATTGLLYSQFGSKAAIASGLYRRGFDRLGARWADFRDDGDTAAKLRSVADFYRRFAHDESVLYRVMFSDASALPENADADFDYGYRMLAPTAEILRAGVAAGEISVDDPGRAAIAFWVALHGHVSIELAGFVGPDEADARYEHLAELLISGLSAPAAPSAAAASDTSTRATDRPRGIRRIPTKGQQK